MAFPFDVLWADVMQDQKTSQGNATINLPCNEIDAARVVLELPPIKAIRNNLDVLGAKGLGRLSKDPTRAAKAAANAAELVTRSEFLSALDLYNEAIRFCPNDSLELPKLFKSRSNVLFQLGQQDAAKKDERRSLETTSLTDSFPSASTKKYTEDNDSSPEDVKYQQNQQRIKSKRSQKKNKPHLSPAKANSLVESGVDQIPCFPNGKNTRLKCASSCVELRTDSSRGRHLVATRNIPAGTVIIIEPAYASAPLATHMTSNCAYCCSPILSPITCPQCAEVMFCDEVCRDRSLEEYHRAECLIFQYLQGGKTLTPMALLVYRVVIKGSKLSSAFSTSGTIQLDEEFLRLHEQPVDNSYPKYYGTGYASAYSQVTNTDSRLPADLLMRAVTAAYLVECLSLALKLASSSSPEKVDTAFNEHYKVVLTSAFYHHLQSSSCNAYQISQQNVPSGNVTATQDCDVGGAIFPTVALLNHACAPNVARHTHGATCIVRTSQVVRSGEELLDNYGPHYLSHADVESRRKHLRIYYFFECICSACTENWPAAALLRTKPLGIICAHCQAPLGVAQTPDNLNSLQKCSRCRKKNDLNLLRTAWRSFEDALPCLITGQFEKALSLSLKLVNALYPNVVQPSYLQESATQFATLLWSLRGNRSYR